MSASARAQNKRRRQLLGGLAGLAAAAATGTTPAFGQAPPSDALVVLFTRTGNTRTVADLVHRERRTALFEIVTREPYPADYETTVAQVSDELDRNYRPPLHATVADIQRYATLYFAFPIWAMTAPPPVRSFLAQHRIGQQRIVPLITHGGYGTGDALDVLARAAPSARIERAFVMEGEQERRVMNRVHAWMATA